MLKLLQKRLRRANGMEYHPRHHSGEASLPVQCYRISENRFGPHGPALPTAEQLIDWRQLARANIGQDGEKPG